MCKVIEFPVRYLKVETIEEVFEQEYEDDELAKAYREYYAEYLELPSKSIKM